MIKKTKTKTFDTDTATVVKKVCFGEFGDPAGYETTMYQTPEGDYFLYTSGGEESPLQDGVHHVLLQVQGPYLDREQLTNTMKKSGCVPLFFVSGKQPSRCLDEGDGASRRPHTVGPGFIGMTQAPDFLTVTSIFRNGSVCRDRVGIVRAAARPDRHSRCL